YSEEHAARYVLFGKMIHLAAVLSLDLLLCLFNRFAGIYRSFFCLLSQTTVGTLSSSNIGLSGRPGLHFCSVLHRSFRGTRLIFFRIRVGCNFSLFLFELLTQLRDRLFESPFLEDLPNALGKIDPLFVRGYIKLLV